MLQGSKMFSNFYEYLQAYTTKVPADSQPIFKENMLVFPWVYSPIAKLFAS
jgi:hypothetical protein